MAQPAAVNFVFEKSLVDVPLCERPLIQGPADIASLFEDLKTMNREVMIVGALDCKCTLLHYGVLAIGSSDRLLIRIGEAFHGAITVLATGIFLVHNHPSGSLVPSRADIDLTCDVANAGLMLGYPLFDHLILSREGHKSLLCSLTLRKFGYNTAEAKFVHNSTGRLGARWLCAGCNVVNETCDLVHLLALQRRAMIPQRCVQCASTAWVRTKASGRRTPVERYFTSTKVAAEGNI